MKRITNHALDSDVEWEQDGLHFIEIISQEYGANHCKFSAGAVEGHPVDTVYLRWGKDGDEGGMLLLRPDEMAAIAYICAGMLYAVEMQRLIDADGK